MYARLPVRSAVPRHLYRDTWIQAEAASGGDSRSLGMLITLATSPLVVSSAESEGTPHALLAAVETNSLDACRTPSPLWNGGQARPIITAGISVR